MAKIITIISGKGGSGKTSFSLALAKVLSKSGVRVLMVDCDMSTHGATFFMKPIIEKYKKSVEKIVSVDDIIMKAKMPPYGFYLNKDTNNMVADLTKLVPVEENFYFLPSDISISNKHKANTVAYFDTFKNCIKEEIENEFDVIIFDCQAGYSDFTRYLASMSNIATLVTLPDPVSAAANKALFFQLGKELEDVQSYQVFNQLTEEEVVSYEKINTSAFFTNLSPMVYSFEVRRAFMRLQIPSYDTCDDYDFNKKILTSLYTLFPEYGEQLNSYKKDLYSLIRRDCESEIQIIKRKEKKKRQNSLLGILEILLIVTALFLSLSFITFSGYLNEEVLFDNKFSVIYIVATFIVFIFAICFVLLQKYYNTSFYNERLDKLEEELNAVTYDSSL